MIDKNRFSKRVVIAEHAFDPAPDEIHEVGTGLHGDGHR